VLEALGAVAPQEDGEHLEVDDALQQLADALEQVVEVEDAGDLARDFVEDSEGLRLAGDTGVEASVLHRDCHARGGQFQQSLMLGGEESGMFGLEVDDADDAILDDQRHGEFRHDVGVRVDVVLNLGDVFDQNGRSLAGRLAHDSTTRLDAHPLDLGRVSGLEAHAQITGAIIHQEDGEDAVVDDRAHQVGHAMHQRVEFERGVQGVRQPHQEVELKRLETDVGRS